MRIQRTWHGLAFLAAIWAAGCTGGNKTGDGKSGSGKSGDGKLRVAFVTNNAEDFWTIAEKGTQKASQDLGVEVEFRKPPQGTKEEQQQIIEDLMNTGIKGLAVSPNDAANSVDFFKKINAKVPLIMQDSDLPDPAARRCYIGTNNYRAGLAVGELVTKAAPQGGKIAIFVGKLDVQNARERRQGVLDYLADPKTQRKEMGDVTAPDAANLKVGNYVLVTTITDNVSQQVCQERAQELMLTNPDLVCLIGLWEYNPPALLRAVRNSKVAAKPIIVGFDENYQTLDGVIAGECYATVVQNPYDFGYQSVKILAGLAGGKEDVLKTLKDTKTGTPLTLEAQNQIFVPHRVITKDNVDEFYKELKQIKGK
jgi:ribose transport system substrate-binding protein